MEWGRAEAEKQAGEFVAWRARSIMIEQASSEIILGDVVEDVVCHCLGPLAVDPFLRMVAGELHLEHAIEDRLDDDGDGDSESGSGSGGGSGGGSSGNEYGSGRAHQQGLRILERTMPGSVVAASYLRT